MTSVNKYYRFFVLALLLFGFHPLAQAGSVVTIQKNGDQYVLMVNGSPFFIRGVGGSSRLQDLHDLGGNSIRTWGIEDLSKVVDGKPLIDRANDLGLKVTAGIWLRQQRSGFDYDDPKMVEQQREDVRNAVLKYKDSPALIIWGLGNEMEGSERDGSDLRVWKEVNVLAGIVKEADPHHPVMTVIAGASPIKIKNLVAYTPNIDILGVNAYGSASGVGAAVTQNGWTKPFILTEFGPTGAWEVDKTSWGAPNEPTANQKAASYYATYNLVVQDSKNICLGTYAFLWGYKYEATATWYGMFLPTGEKLPQVDAIVYAWTGKWPEKRCPKLKQILHNLTDLTAAPGAQIQFVADSTDPNNAPMQYEWSLLDEVKTKSIGGDEDAHAAAHPEAIVSAKDNQVTVKAPTIPGPYRMFVTIRDGLGGATTGNVAFQVK